MSTRETFKPNTVVCADCYDVLQTMETDSVDCVIIDPPFGTGTQDWDVAPSEDMWEEIRRVGKDMFAVFGYPENQISAANYFSDLVLSGHIVWVHYSNARVTRGLTGFHQDIAIWSTGKHRVKADRVRDPYTMSQHLEKFFCVPGGADEKRDRIAHAYEHLGKEFDRAAGRRCTDVWLIPAPGVGFNTHLRLHPAEKPLFLLERLVLLLSDPGQLIADFFCGSGTTLVAAAKHDRQYFGCDVVQKYVDTAKARLVDPWAEYRKPQEVHPSMETLF